MTSLHSPATKRASNKLICDECYVSVINYEEINTNSGNNAIEKPKMNCVSNNLMSYVQFYIHQSSCENIRTVIQRFYSPEEISEAKFLIRKVADEKIIGGRINCIKSTCMVRMPHEADVVDIVTAFQKSVLQEAELPSFGATNFDRVAMYAPEQMEHAAVRDLNINQRL